MKVTSEHIEYLQRSGRPPEAMPAVKPESVVPEQLRCLSRISTIGIDAFDPTFDRAQAPSSDLPVSLYAARISVAYLVVGRGDAVEVYIGNWQRGAPDAAAAAALTARQEIIEAGLRSIYPASILEPLSSASMRALMADLGHLTASGYVLGLPSVKPAPWDRKSYPLDRVIRALRGGNWACLLLAEPVPETHVNKERDAAIEELKDIPEVNRTAPEPPDLRVLKRPSPPEESQEKPNVLGAYYKELLTLQLQTLIACLGAGAWRTAMYLSGDATYYRLASVWRGVFSGEEALLEPVRVWAGNLNPFINHWAMSDARSQPGPGRVRRLLEHQTILSSQQLAAYLHLPRVEVNGFSIKTIATFGAAPRRMLPGGECLNIGKVLSRDNLALDHLSEPRYENLPDTFYAIRPDDLTRHVFIAGVTGSGKTTTIFHLLKEAFRLGVNFLVIEPAKTEYRALMHHEKMKEKLQIFTLGDEQTSPLRMNPFEVPGGTSISKHIDLLRSLFSGCFGFWTPLPQILEECLYRIYKDRGWDIAANLNHRLNSSGTDPVDPLAFPTLSDLLAMVDEVTSQLKWDREAVSRIQGNLRDRLRSLKNGARGRMLDVQQSVPMSVLLENPTIIELEGIGDDDEKAFLMGLLLIRLVEFRRGTREKPDVPSKRKLQHLLVFEEAHRLLENVAIKGGEGAANPRANLVTTFANFLSEIRSYGQGVIVTDQVPVKLAPDVIKNTNLKIAHRVVDRDDRKLLAGAMAMNDEQTDTIAKLLPGTAAIYSEGDNVPLLVKMPGLGQAQASPADEKVAMHSCNSGALAPYREIFLRHRGCTDTQTGGGASCDAALLLVDSPNFQRSFLRLVMSILEDETAMEKLWPQLEFHIDTARQIGVSRETLIRCLLSRAADWFAFRRGIYGGWKYDETRELREALYHALMKRENAAERPAAVGAFRRSMWQLHQRKRPPYPNCASICNQEVPLCLYRKAVLDVHNEGQFTAWFTAANPGNPGPTTGPKQAWDVSKRVALQIVDTAAAQKEAIQRIALCYSQMMIYDHCDSFSPNEQRAVFASVMLEKDNV
jgi:hypothetical protein